MFQAFLLKIRTLLLNDQILKLNFEKEPNLGLSSNLKIIHLIRICDVFCGSLNRQTQFFITFIAKMNK